MRQSDAMPRLPPTRPESDVMTAPMISFSASDWRFNLRMSNTEPVVRLNVESRADIPLMEEKTEELLAEMQRLNEER